jgi:hypothetical protein
VGDRIIKVYKSSRKVYIGKFQENSFRVRHDVPCGRTDTQTDGQKATMIMFVFDFRNYANAPKI